MALFRMKWLRRFVRRNTTPIAENKAELWKRRLSIGYAIFAWQAFGLVCYMAYTGRADYAKYYGYTSKEEETQSPAEHYTKRFNMPKATVIRLSGLTKLEEIDIDYTKNTDGNK